jgi:isoleucyl-tRNA synthetase
LDGTPPFRQNFSYATLLAEDGSAMHKSSGNMIEFNEAADKMGVDVMRWLYCAHKPENNLLFGYGRADEVRRQFLIPLWNVYKFFTSYANLDGWAPTGPGYTAERPEGPLPQSDNPLDRWVLARINQVIGRVAAALENSDSYTATLAVEEFLDDLTNWYVRRSRPRFWKSEHDTDKQTAYATLYYVMVRLIKVLAPMIPFVTETLYQNLVRAVLPDALESVHHNLWPTVDPTDGEQVLLDEMALARRIASLGRGARNSANIKLRQPLAKALAYVGEVTAHLSDWLTEIVADELNVKGLEFVADEATLVTYRLVADGRTLGPKLGGKFPIVRAAVAALDAGAAVRRLRAGEPLTLDVAGETVTLTAEELIVDTQPLPGLAVAADKAVTVAVDAVITRDLEREGLVRDLIRHVQSLRRDADYQMDDRIAVGLLGLDGELAEAVAQFRDLLCAETLCVDLSLAAGGEWDVVKALKVGGVEVEVGVRR